MTSIGVLKELEGYGLLEKLQNYSNRNKIFHPSEGTFDIHSKIGIYNCLNENKIYDITIIEECYESQKKMDLKNISELEFINKIDFKDYYIFSSNKEILFTIDWDSFFFLIGIDSQKISKETVEKNFYGFWAKKEDTHLWYQ
ncbi:hypothetical protein AWR41_02300 [Riemerella anatipestifer]|uniref:hypothetical protein n=1 Tax=Riemerella anatipestifer TaxID=34085 RepID=UPI0007ED852A|nr:hypothetical protein [Riemerella anatipestifer]OBP42962.1 hypothetical protein AWR41_02300 [Riemerella anatipestifer]